MKDLEKHKTDFEYWLITGEQSYNSKIFRTPEEMTVYWLSKMEELKAEIRKEIEESKCHIEESITDSELSSEGVKNRIYDRTYNKVIDDLLEIESLQ